MLGQPMIALVGTRKGRLQDDKGKNGYGGMCLGGLRSDADADHGSGWALEVMETTRLAKDMGRDDPKGHALSSELPERSKDRIPLAVSALGVRMLCIHKWSIRGLSLCELFLSVE